MNHRNITSDWRWHINYVIGRKENQLIMKKVIGSNQRGFVKSKSCLTNLIVFYDEMTALVDEVRAEDIVYLKYSKYGHCLP